MIRRSQGKARLEAPRIGEMGLPAATVERPRDRREQNRENATLRPSKRALRANLRALIGEAIDEALPSDAAPAASRLVAHNALQLAADAAREVGATSSLFVQHHTTRFGVNAALAGFFTQAAAEAGFDTARGLELLAAAHECEACATRAMVAAAAAVKSFAGAKRKTNVPSQAVEDEYRRFLEAEQLPDAGGEP